MGIIITTEPVDVTVDGVSFQLQGDPSATDHWGHLLDLEIKYTTSAERDKVQAELTDALAGMAETPKDADTIRGLNLGIVTLKKVAEQYVRDVTGFPTPPPSRSKKP